MIHAGFDVGGTNIKAGIVDDAEMKILTKRNVPFPRGSYKNTAEVFERLAAEMTEELGASVFDLASVGVAIPGSIDPSGKTIINAHNLDFHNVPMKAEAARRFPGKPIHLANDANAAALAELHAGALRGCTTGVLMTLGTGVGGGLILGGRMFNGGLGHGVELGHMTLQYGGAPCTCGNLGCIESYCTATWLAAQGRQVLKEKRDSLIVKKSADNPRRVNAKTVIDSAKEGDPAAGEIFAQYIDYLSAAIVSVTALLDPEIVALGGGVSLAGDALFVPLRKKVEAQSFFRYPYRIVPAEMGNDAGIIGAAMLDKNAQIR